MVTKCHQIKIINERWEGKCNMVCDVMFKGRLTSNVSLEASPPLKEAEVFFPIRTNLLDEDQAAIHNALLAYYYDVEIDDYVANPASPQRGAGCKPFNTRHHFAVIP